MKAIEEPATGNLPLPTKVIVTFSGYSPPFDPEPIIRRMLGSVPTKYLVGLDAVVLSNATGLSNTRRKQRVKSRRRKFQLGKVRGLYHPASEGNAAWIEVFMDNALRGWETGWWLKVPFVREGKLADVLFHEIGHHIHYAIRPEHRETEDVADGWKVRLTRNYQKQRHPLLRLFARTFRPLIGKLLHRQHEKVALQMLKSGQISKAEYGESVGRK